MLCFWLSQNFASGVRSAQRMRCIWICPAVVSWLGRDVSPSWFCNAGRCCLCDCGSELKVQLRTVCIATGLSIECEECSYKFTGSGPAGTETHFGPDEKNYERSTYCAIKVLCVCGFLAMGDSGSEAAKLLGLLGLPNDTTMETRSFSAIEKRMSPIIRKLCDEILDENLIKEVEKSMANDQSFTAEDFNRWKQSLQDPTAQLDDAKKPKIEVSCDMAWQQKGSG